MGNLKTVQDSAIVVELQRIDPASLLNSECLGIFYDTINQYDKVTNKEWNDLIRYVRYLNEFYKNNPITAKLQI